MVEEIIRTQDMPKGYGLHTGDSRDLSDIVGENLSGETPLDVTITSPPYTDMKEYAADPDVQIGFGQEYENYLDELRDVFKQVYDATKDTGTLWVVVNTLKRDQRVVRLPFDIADVCENLQNVTTCEECGEQLQKNRETALLTCPNCDWEHNPLDESWRLQDIVIWDKKRARPWSGKGQFRNVFEYILCFSKEKSGFKFNLDEIRVAETEDFKKWWVQFPERYNPRGKVPANIWEHLTPTQGSWGEVDVDHPAPFPPGMVDRIIELTTEPGDTVCDPFAGSGIVLSRAHKHGRNPFGIELSEEYAKMFERNVVENEGYHQEPADDEKQNKLEELICTLRQLKYPRTLGKELRDELNADSAADINLNTIFQLSHGTFTDESGEQVMETDTYIVVNDETMEEKKEEMQKVAEEIATRSPCSNFGIDANINVVRPGEIINTVWKNWDDPLYLYSDNHHQCNNSISLESWESYAYDPHIWRKNHGSKNYPPVISNLYVDVEDPARADEPISLDEALSFSERDVSEIAPNEQTGIEEWTE